MRQRRFELMNSSIFRSRTLLQFTAALLCFHTLVAGKVIAREWIVWFADEPSLSWAVTELNTVISKEEIGAKGRGVAIMYLRMGLGIEEVFMDPTTAIDVRKWDQVKLTGSFDAVDWASDLLKKLDGGGKSEVDKNSYQLYLICTVYEWIVFEGSPRLNRHPFFQFTKARGSPKARAIKVISQIVRRLVGKVLIPANAQKEVIADFWLNRVVRPSFLDVKTVTFDERLCVIRMKPADAEEIDAKGTGTDWANSVENIYE